MRKLWILAPLFGVLLSTCSNEFEIAAPWKSIPVIYAMLSPKDTAHYVRIEKAFLDPTVSALVVAQNPDSIYYPDDQIAVYLQKVGDALRYKMYRVNGVDEGIVRDSGIFASSPNYLYKIRQSEIPGGLKEGATYRIVLERLDGSPTVTAETTLPAAFLITIPDPSAIPPKIQFKKDQTTTVEWRTDVNGLFFNIDLRIRYHEEDANGAVINRDTIDWAAARNVKRNASPSGAGGIYRGSTQLSGEAFFALLQQNIGNSSTRFRYFDGFDIMMEGGGREIEEYLITQQANSGITGAEVVTTYTNVMPEGSGFGLVSGKNRFEMLNIRVDPKTIEYMKNDPDLALLNFK